MSSIEKIVVGTRGSRLAQVQTRLVVAALQQRLPRLEVEVSTVKTGGDRDKASPFASFAEKGIFVKELEEELLAGRIDIAVHSLKDMPTELPDRLTLAAVLPRESPLDSLVSRENKLLSGLDSGARVGTGSLRRRAFVLRKRPDVEVNEIRGNLDTRLRKVHDGQYEAVVVSQAAMLRMGKASSIAEVFPAAECLPAPGQGAIAIEARSDSEAVLELVGFLDHPYSRNEVVAERSFLAALGGGCRVPVGSLATRKGEEFEIRGDISAPDGSRRIAGEMRGQVKCVEDAENIGVALGQELLAKGAKELLSW
ncbi:MAG: hydroxymethylbilane synthase [Candidatus Eiseniibacteriota bacterium]|nr:MAG: hydroxymethylbilane synthase [Candidatus Eisenbacteria bacterium]